ncbi:hypothetical protein GCM10025886_02400 [Tetragenococcus halophilus subsp. flandriensis]|uniref:tyrosine-type recombinase/integrase n=1 Tax=Tetragenococcus halophilus TaxID=51669 RepID=UPI0023E9F0A4|nr:site-specific integrase [Tetragenococcus halophilus]GMA07089.1 hypothetical protein GCM10025886_02400 [Tetragenococcus halophilus subsp. flandriensis]
MPKSKIFKVNSYGIKQAKDKNRTTITEGWDIVNKQAVGEDLRPATMRDYKNFYFDYVEFNQFVYIDQFNSDSIYRWLASMNVQATTKRIRLKALKAVLGRLYNAGELETKFYKSIVVRVNEETKEGTTREDIEKFLSCIDVTDYFQLRDASMVLIIWYTGIRAMTLAQLTTNMVDFEEGLLTCPALIMKNHHRLVLPLNKTVLDMLRMLIEQNEIIKEELSIDTDLIFFTQNGHQFVDKNSRTTISKRLNVYAQEFNIEHLNTHAIRRGFAKRLLDEGTSVPIISKALGHSSLATTTKYLNISEAELINELKKLR